MTTVTAPADAPEVVAARISALLPAIAAAAAENDTHAANLGTYVAQLADAGLGRLRVPAAHGGAGATTTELAQVLLSVAEADSNLTQIFRGHIGFIEQIRLLDASHPARNIILDAAGRGEIFAPAASELGPGGPLNLGTTLRSDGQRRLLNGKKYYSTGSLFANYINVLTPIDDGLADVVVERRAPGVTVIDDWNGFGQRSTASGTATFEDVDVDPALILPHGDSDVRRYVTAVYQFVHSATQAGIARRLTSDLTELVRDRNRTYPTAQHEQPRHDPQVLEVLGRISAKAYGAESAVTVLAGLLGRYSDQPEPDASVLDEAAASSARTQILNTTLLSEVTWSFFDAAGASATSRTTNFDRHWRNARTVSSHNPVIYKARLVGDHVVNGGWGA